jgi:signal transduction histidine kinase
MKLFRHLEQGPRVVLILISLGFLALVGVIDYLTGFQISFSVFYLAAVGLAAWFIGKGYGFFFSVLSVAVSILGDIAAGAHYPSPFIPIWNAAILLFFYFIVVWLLTDLRASQKELESKVRQRTTALTREIAERERLEKEILEVSEREQRRIGHDLHDSLCQHLTATAMAGQVLGEKLAARSLPESAEAREIVRLVQDGIALTRNLAHGLSPFDLDAEGLVTGLRELAAGISKTSKIVGTFECESPPAIRDANAATQLYRIAQEAVNNALRHGKPRQIVMSLFDRKGRIELTIEDDGVGLPDDWQKNRGLGTHIMAHRAAMMGGTFSIEPNPTGGTYVKCSIPTPATA